MAKASDTLPCEGCPDRAECSERMLKRMPAARWHKHFGQLRCGKLRAWLGRHCSAHSSPKATPVDDLDALHDEIVGVVRGGRLVDEHFDDLDGRSVHIPGQRTYCRDCGNWRKSRFCKWLDDDIDGDSRADGCAGFRW